jgi:hypothetical protein
MGMTELESMAVEMPVVEGHPNRAAFRGVLTVVDAPSQRAPSGSGGRRVVLTKKAAEDGLPSLIGMAVDYAPSFDRHDVRRKVGVITSANVVGRNLEIGGYLYAKDFPDIVAEVAKCGRRTSAGLLTEGAKLRASLAAAVERIRSLAASMQSRSEDVMPAALRAETGGTNAGELGMSFEVTEVVPADKRAKVWKLEKVTFTGAAILRKAKAAYQDTWIGLSL